MNRHEWIPTDTGGGRWELWRVDRRHRHFIGRVVATPEGRYEYGFTTPPTRRWIAGEEATLALAARAVLGAASP